MEFTQKMNITMTEHVVGLCKNQDYTVTGQGELNGQLFDFGVLLDGHGTHHFINLMREQNWTQIMSTEDPWSTLHDILKNIRFPRNISSGSTILMMRAFEDRIETISIGDSQIVIYKNDEYVYGTTPHNKKNPSEVKRIESHPYYTHSKQQRNVIPSIRSSTKLVGVRSEYHYFSNDTMLAMTQAIGHNDITGYEPERNTILFEKSDKMDVIMGSDGLWEMIVLVTHQAGIPDEYLEDVLKDAEDLLQMNAAELVSKAEARWKKVDWEFHWNILEPAVFIKTSFGGQYDDISAIKWSKGTETVSLEGRPSINP